MNIGKPLYIAVAISFVHKIVGLPFYHQNDYTILPERADFLWYNHSCFANLKWKLGWYNRTRRTVEASFNLLRNLSTDVTAVLQFYKFASNEYREFPMRVGMNLCAEYKRNNFKLREFVKGISNVPDNCPIEKGFYWIKSNGRYLDISTFPPYIPKGQYKAHIQVSFQSALAAELDFYATIKEIPREWK